MAFLFQVARLIIKSSSNKVVSIFHNIYNLIGTIVDGELQKHYQSTEALLTDVTKFTYVENTESYLSVILNYGENKFVALNCLSIINNALIRDKVRQIKDKITSTQILLTPNDGGYQYTSYWFYNFMKKHQLTHIMSRVGKYFDKGSMENFWGIIKEEMCQLKTDMNFKELEHNIKKYIGFYNIQPVRLKMGVSRLHQFF